MCRVPTLVGLDSLLAEPRAEVAVEDVRLYVKLQWPREGQRF
jgi:hypothetical protein